MTSSSTLVSAMLMATAVALTGCHKKTEPASDTPPATAVAAPANVVQAPVTPAAAPAPAASTAQAAPAPGSTFDINSVPVTNAALPPFPYLDWPEKLPADQRQQDDELDFDATNVVVGGEVRSIEGRVQRRYYSLSTAKLSALAAERNYDGALKNMGFVQVNRMQPRDDEFEKAYPDMPDMRKSFKLLDFGKYKSYLARTPKGNVWVVLTITDDNVNIVAIEEKALQQSIKPLSAAQLQLELTAKGHVALYLNFDTDKAIILARDQGTVTEVGRMMADNAALKLKVEGHTDSSGDATHNQALSEQRANAVVASLVERGIDRTRLAALGLGGSQPVADNGTAEGRAKNRRVELVKQG